MLWSDLGWGSQAYTWWVQFNVEWVLAQIKSWVGKKKKKKRVWQRERKVLRSMWGVKYMTSSQKILANLEEGSGS